MAGALTRPDPGEYGAFYRGYVDRVPDGDILALLEAGMVEARALLDAVPADREEHRYAPGKWSVREVVGHLSDAERVFTYRALSMARGDAAPLPGMDQDVWTAGSGAHRRPLAELTAEWAAVRGAGLHLFRSLDDGAAGRTGRASDSPFTVRAFPWIIAGHALHHMERLRVDYLGTA